LCGGSFGEKKQKQKSNKSSNKPTHFTAVKTTVKKQSTPSQV